MPELADRLQALEGEVRDELVPQIRSLEGAVNALAARNKTGWLGRTFQNPVVLVFLLSISGAAVSFAIRNFLQVQDNSRDIANLKSIVPALTANFEQLAASTDNICVAVARVHEFQLNGRSNGTISCGRTPIVPLLVKP